MVQVFGIGQCSCPGQVVDSCLFNQTSNGCRWWVQSLYFSIKMMVKLNHCGSYTNQKLIFTKTNCGRPTWNRGGTSSILFFRRDRLVVLRIHIDLVKPSLGLRKTVKRPAKRSNQNQEITLGSIWHLASSVLSKSFTLARNHNLPYTEVWHHRGTQLCWVSRQWALIQPMLHRLKEFVQQNRNNQKDSHVSWRMSW